MLTRKLSCRYRRSLLILRHPHQLGQRADLQADGDVNNYEFGLGLYDGITGLVTQPVNGAQKEGVVGALKGFGKGIGGIVLKPSAAACGVPGYTLKGIYKGLQNMRGADVQDSIAAAHAAQGLEDWKRSSPEERAEVVRRWRSR